MTMCTENYECLVLDNTSKSNRIEDCVFFYKARPRSNFRIGSPSLWTFHTKNYNPQHDNEKVDPKKKGVVTIKKVK
jgi:hypothetical protein